MGFEYKCRVGLPQPIFCFIKIFNFRAFRLDWYRYKIRRKSFFPLKGERIKGTCLQKVEFLSGLGSRSRSEPGVFGSLEPEPLEKKNRSRSRSRLVKKSGAGVA